MPFAKTGEFGGMDQPGGVQFDPASPMGVERFFKNAQMIAPQQPELWGDIAKQLHAESAGTVRPPDDGGPPGQSAGVMGGGGGGFGGIRQRAGGGLGGVAGGMPRRGPFGF